MMDKRYKLYTGIFHLKPVNIFSFMTSHKTYKSYTDNFHLKTANGLY